VIRCTGVVKDPATGAVTEVRATYDAATGNGPTTDGRKVKATIHWVSAAHAVDGEVRLYDTLFTSENPDDVPEGRDFTEFLNPNSLEVVTGCKLEPALGAARPARRGSSSGSATSASIATRGPARRCSIAPCRSRTRGRASSSALGRPGRERFESRSRDARATSPARVRFAPSPSGYLHVGGARTALYNYLHAAPRRHVRVAHRGHRRRALVRGIGARDPRQHALARG
jgi:hypothetical protein